MDGVPDDEMELAEALADIHDPALSCGSDDCPDCARELADAITYLVDAFSDGDN